MSIYRCIFMSLSMYIYVQQVGLKLSHLPALSALSHLSHLSDPSDLSTNTYPSDLPDMSIVGILCILPH